MDKTKGIFGFLLPFLIDNGEKPDFIAHLADISAPFGVRMHIEDDGVVKCEWTATCDKAGSPNDVCP